MTILYLDCYAGISGDMTVAALLDLGVPLEHLQTELARLSLPVGSYQLSTRPVTRGQVAGLKFDVAVHDHHTHRHYAHIQAMIADSALAEGVRQRAERIFRRLAEAEALVHDVPLQEVHFHEVGGVDSIVDIVGVAIGLEYLGVERIHAAPLPLGGGFVETAHGRLPVPAPATAELLKGLAVHGLCGAGERVTPTGAAIVAALAHSGPRPVMTLQRIGCGAGEKEFSDCANVLRALLGTAQEYPALPETVLVVETNIDDSTGEQLGYVLERLLEAGALDVFFTPIQMKKNRPAVKLSFLCRPEQLDSLGRLVLTESSAIGLRHYPASRMVLERRSEERLTALGTVRYKLILEGGGLLRAVPEYEECRRIARERGMTLREVMALLEREQPGTPGGHG